VNVGGLRNVIDVCRTRRIPRLVNTSSFLALPRAGRGEPVRATDAAGALEELLDGGPAARAGLFDHIIGSRPGGDAAGPDRTEDISPCPRIAAISSRIRLPPRPPGKAPSTG
jgi:hypothetical protein